MKELYYLIPYYTGESATMWHSTHLTAVIPLIRTIPEKLTRDIFACAFCGYLDQNSLTRDFDIDNFAELGPCVYMDKIAVIPFHLLGDLEIRVKRLWQDVGDDSSAYAAAEEFAELMENNAIKIFDMWKEDGKINI